jgi:hypothetical protein
MHRQVASDLGIIHLHHLMRSSRSLEFSERTLKRSSLHLQELGQQLEQLVGGDKTYSS